MTEIVSMNVKFSINRGLIDIVFNKNTGIYNITNKVQSIPDDDCKSSYIFNYAQCTGKSYVNESGHVIYEQIERLLNKHNHMEITDEDTIITLDNATPDEIYKKLLEYCWFPYRHYENNVLYKEFERLRKWSEKVQLVNDKLKRNNIGYKCSNYFFQHERMNTRTTKRYSTLSAWNEHKDKMLDYYLRTKKQHSDIFGAIQFLNHSPAQFCPAVAIQIYKYFNATKVLDIFAGWGDRCLSAMVLNIDYIGIDSNQNLIEPYRNLIATYRHLTTSDVSCIHSKCEDIDIDTLDFDIVLTSPPFWENDKPMEHYAYMEHCPMNEFMDSVFVPVLRRCMQKARWSCFYMPYHMYEYVVNMYAIECDKILSFSAGGNMSPTRQDLIFCYKKK